MPGWIDEFAGAMHQVPLDPSETEELLTTARDVAHRVERRVTPLATFLLGMEVGTQMAAGRPRDVAIAGSIAELRRRLPDDPVPPGSPSTG